MNASSGFGGHPLKTGSCPSVTSEMTEVTERNIRAEGRRGRRDPQVGGWSRLSDALEVSIPFRSFRTSGDYLTYLKYVEI